MMTSVSVNIQNEKLTSETIQNNEASSFIVSVRFFADEVA